MAVIVGGRAVEVAGILFGEIVFLVPDHCTKEGWGIYW